MRDRKPSLSIAQVTTDLVNNIKDFYDAKGQPVSVGSSFSTDGDVTVITDSVPKDVSDALLAFFKQQDIIVRFTPTASGVEHRIPSGQADPQKIAAVNKALVEAIADLKLGNEMAANFNFVHRNQLSQRKLRTVEQFIAEADLGVEPNDKKKLLGHIRQLIKNGQEREI